MARHYHKFTKEDDDIIIKEIQLFPENLKACFEEASKKIGVSTTSVHDRYYKNIKRNNTCFTLISKEQGIVNTKNFPLKNIGTKIEERQVYVDTPKSFWNRVVSNFKKYIPFIN